jgi:succinate dehydrogenase/fumarate reductase flavoprotein subunit
MKKTSNFIEEEIETDILVVGAGAGGMMAAISAADRGTRVILCEMGNARRSGGITGGNDHYQCFIPDIHGPEVKEKLIREHSTIFGGSRDFIVRRIETAHSVLKMWENWGINMKTDGHYEFTGHGWPGSTGKMGEPGNTNRTWIHFSDNEVCPKLEAQVKERGIRIMNRVKVTELLKGSNGRVVGAIAISTREPNFLFSRPNA